MINLSKENRRSLIFLVPAAVLFILSLFSGIRTWMRVVFAVLSLICSLLDAFSAIRKDIGAKRFMSPAVLIALASVAGIISGHFSSAAAAFLVFRLCVILLDLRLERTRGVVGTRLSMSGLEESCAKYNPVPVVSGRLYMFINSYFSYILIAGAVIVLIFASILSGRGISEGLYRAAVLLSSASAVWLFAVYPPADYASVAAAAENGTVFADGAIEKLLRASAVYPSRTEPVFFGRVAVITSADNLLNAESVLLLASHALRAVSDGNEKISALADTICAAYGRDLDMSAVSEAHYLSGMGAIAKIHDMTVLTGSAELMNNGGLPAVGFTDLGDCVHVAVNGRYAGCVVLSPISLSDEEFSEELNILGLHSISLPENRDGNECVLAFSCDGLAPEELHNSDIYAAECGYSFKDSYKAPDILVSSLGNKAMHRVLRLTYNALAVRTGAFAISAAVRLLVILAGIFGFIPLWLAVLAQAAALYASYIFVLRSLDFTVD